MKRNFCRSAMLAGLGLGLIACSHQAENRQPELSMEQVARGTLSKKPTAPFEPQAIISQAGPGTTASHSAAKSLADRLRGHPRTLYWLEKDAYGLYLGEELSAELDNGQHITLQDASNEESVKTCQFGVNGDLSQAINTDDAQCQQMMFSLDQALED